MSGKSVLLCSRLLKQACFFTFRRPSKQAFISKCLKKVTVILETLFLSFRETFLSSVATSWTCAGDKGAGHCIRCHQTVTVRPFHHHSRSLLNDRFHIIFFIFSSGFVALTILLISLASKLLSLSSICGHAFQLGVFFKSTLINSRRFHEKDTFGFDRGGGLWL